MHARLHALRRRSDEDRRRTRHRCGGTERSPATRSRSSCLRRRSPADVYSCFRRRQGHRAATELNADLFARSTLTSRAADIHRSRRNARPRLGDARRRTRRTATAAARRSRRSAQRVESGVRRRASVPRDPRVTGLEHPPAQPARLRRLRRGASSRASSAGWGVDDEHDFLTAIDVARRGRRRRSRSPGDLRLQLRRLHDELAHRAYGSVQGRRVGRVRH